MSSSPSSWGILKTMSRQTRPAAKAATIVAQGSRGGRAPPPMVCAQVPFDRAVPPCAGPARRQRHGTGSRWNLSELAPRWTRRHSTTIGRRCDWCRRRRPRAHRRTTPPGASAPIERIASQNERSLQERAAAEGRRANRERSRRRRVHQEAWPPAMPAPPEEPLAHHEAAEREAEAERPEGPGAPAPDADPAEERRRQHG